MKPGITGLAQVKRYRGETTQLSSMEKRVNADMEYLEDWTFWGDILITLQTVFGPGEDKVLSPKFASKTQSINEIGTMDKQKKCETSIAS